MKKILIIAPHMDDEALGCGGVIAKHKAGGDKVSVIFVAHRAYNHNFDNKLNDIEKSHALKAKRILGYDEAVFLDLPDERLDVAVQDIIIPVENYFAKIKPGIVYIPFSGDNNQDHRAVFDAARVVLRPTAALFVSNIFMYEVPSSTEQSLPTPNTVFMPNYYVDIKAFVNKKLRALRCYETESRNYPHPRSPEGIGILAQKRGTEIGLKYAEAFMSVRGKWI